MNNMKHLNNNQSTTNFCSRRAFHRLSVRQRQRITIELRRNRIDVPSYSLRSHHRIPESKVLVDHPVSINSSATSDHSCSSASILFERVDSGLANSSESEQSFSSINATTTYVTNSDEDIEDESKVNIYI